jgi:diguanylate cyclase (GGDEF)-like protein
VQRVAVWLLLLIAMVNLALGYFLAVHLDHAHPLVRISITLPTAAWPRANSTAGGASWFSLRSWLSPRVWFTALRGALRPSAWTAWLRRMSRSSGSAGDDLARLTGWAGIDRPAASAALPNRRPDTTLAALDAWRRQIMAVDSELRTLGPDDDRAVERLRGLVAPTRDYQAAASERLATLRPASSEADGADGPERAPSLVTELEAHLAQVEIARTALEQVLDGPADVTEADRAAARREESLRLFETAVAGRDRLQAAAVRAADDSAAESERCSGTIDELTGMLVRSGIVQVIGQQCQPEAHDGAGRRNSLVLVDLHQTGVMNRRHGLELGEALIAALARIVDQLHRPADTVARTAGQQYAVFTPGTGPQQAAFLAERIRQSVRAARFLAPAAGLEAAFEATVTCAVIGLRDDESPAAALERLELGLVEAKRLGPDRTYLVDDDPPAPFAPPDYRFPLRTIPLDTLAG